MLRTGTDRKTVSFVGTAKCSKFGFKEVLARNYLSKDFLPTNSCDYHFGMRSWLSGCLFYNSRNDFYLLTLLE